MANSTYVQYYFYADIVGGSEKVQNYADVIHGWSLNEQELSNFDET